MFNGATSFNADLSCWDLSRVVQVTGMFTGATAYTYAQPPVGPTSGCPTPSPTRSPTSAPTTPAPTPAVPEDMRPLFVKAFFGVLGLIIVLSVIGCCCRRYVCKAKEEEKPESKQPVEVAIDNNGQLVVTRGGDTTL